MAYVHRVVKAGPCVEHKKMQSFRVHTKGVKRSPNTGHTTEKQERINERVAEEHLRWDINANFGHRDLHAVLHYYVKDSSFEEILENKAAFLRNLRKLCKKRGITFKAVVVIETKRMTNPHIHVNLTYYINRSDSARAVAIQAAVAQAVEEYKTWQRTIGRDVNPSQLAAMVMEAGAKRVTVTAPTFAAVAATKVAALTGSATVTYGGLEDD